MEKNEVYEGEVSGYGSDGEGIVKLQGTTAFVPFCLTGEKIRFKTLKVKGNVAYGKLTEIVAPSPVRVEPVCPVYGKCGGCGLQHMSYSEQLKFKRDTVANALKKIGNTDAEVGLTVPCGREYFYRNKLALPIGVNEKGATVVGFYASRSHRIVDTDGCAIQAEWAADVIRFVREYAAENGLCGYDEAGGDGVLRHIVVRELKGRFIFALVATRIIDVKPLISKLDKRFKEFTFLLNVNDRRTNVIFGNEWHICRGEGFYTAEESGIKYRAGAETFIQVNDEIRDKLYASVVSQANAGEAALDLYSGGGLLTAMLAKKCGSAYGIEIVEEASRCADELKALNGLEGRMFNICGAVEDKLDEVFSKTEGMRRIIVCDPPRKGMERSVVNAVKNSGADKIVLVSCNPATLARDMGLLIGTLEERGGAIVKAAANAVSPYVIESVTPFDMFPQTRHVETLVVLTKKI